jgi:peptidylprolyl isomerase
MATKKTTAAKSTAKKKTAKKTTAKKPAAKKTLSVDGSSMVELHYKGTLKDGTMFDSSYDRGEPIRVEIGQAQLIKGFENALIGMKAGQKKSFTLTPDEAYGSSNPDAFSTVQRDQFPPDYIFVEGQAVQGATEAGQPIFATIASFNDSDVILDLNHPLAGKDLNFDIEIVELQHNPHNPAGSTSSNSGTPTAAE